MKISQKLEQAKKERRTWWSFEYFPPRTAQVCRFRHSIPHLLPTVPNRAYKTLSIVSNACDSSAPSSLTLHGVLSRVMLYLPKDRILTCSQAFWWTDFRTHDRDDQVLPGDDWSRDMHASDVYQHAARKDRHSSYGASSLRSTIARRPTPSLDLGCQGARLSQCSGTSGRPSSWERGLGGR